MKSEHFDRCVKEGLVLPSDDPGSLAIPFKVALGKGYRWYCETCRFTWKQTATHHQTCKVKANESIATAARRFEERPLSTALEQAIQPPSRHFCKCGAEIDIVAGCAQCDQCVYTKEAPKEESPIAPLLRAAIETANHRHQQYGANFHIPGELLRLALNGASLPTETATDFNRIRIVFLMFDKLTRYVQAVARGNKEAADDSLHDAGVYSFMLQTLEGNKPRL